MRIFVAVDLATRIRRGVGTFAADLAGRLVSARLVHRGGATWVAERNLHLTMRFIGEVDETTAAGVMAALAPPFDRPPFDLSLDRLGVFPPVGPPRVLWISVGGGAPELAVLARAIDERLAGAGIAPEARPFSGHLTLARFKRPPDRGLRDALVSLAPPRPFGPSAVDHVTVYESHLSPTGPTYRALARGLLADPSSPARRRS